MNFRPGSDAEFLVLFAQVAVGSLDTGTQHAVRELGAEGQARDDLEYCPGERGWWRVAFAQDGTPVGFAIPTATSNSRHVGYLGILPRERGRGLVDDVLAEITRIHAGSGADIITASTDIKNTPMAVALERAGLRSCRRVPDA